MSARSELAALLTPLLPKTWKVITTETNVDKLDRTLLRLRQTTIARHPAAPLSKHLVTFEVRVTVPGVDAAKAEDRLDAELAILLFAINSLGGSIAWDTATKGLDPDTQGLAYELTLTASIDRPAAPTTTQ
ncbi:hypothetical protein [Marisediminicola sp. LYQ85]|uniref:hypothetical protein n=1 Tax=Marisediminicola sp. LYQ85 TaxID=3391062 RepID=UPI0039834729